MAAKNEFGYIQIEMLNRKRDLDLDDSHFNKLKLTFTNEKVYRDTLFELMYHTKGIRILDNSWGFTIHQTMESALQDVDFWNR